MPVVAVAVPATPLLVPGAAGGAEVLTGVRALVDEALAELLADHAGGPLLVLARSSQTRSGVMRPSFASAGIADRWVPGVASWPAGGADAVPAAEVPASVALCCLADAVDALRAAGHVAPTPDVVVHELGPDDEAPADVVARVQASGGVVVVSGEALGAATEGGWHPEAREVPGRAAGGPGAEHLQDIYRVTVFRAAARTGRGSPAHDGPDAGQEAPRA